MFSEIVGGLSSAARTPTARADIRLSLDPV